METLSYIASLIATGLGLYEPFGKNMKTILIFNFLGNLLVATSYLLIGAYNGAAICFVACLQVSINFYFDFHRKKVPWWMILIHAVSFLAVNIMTFSAWYDVLAVGAALLFVLSVAQSDARYYRFLFIGNSSLWIIYDFLSRAYGNLFTHIALFIATFISIIIRNKKQS